MTRYEIAQKEIENTNQEIEKKENEIKKLIEQNPIIEEYLSLKDEIKKLQNEIIQYKKVIPYIKMYDCKHIFVVTKISKDENLFPNVYQCICCGFTNNVPDKLKEFRNECFVKTRKNSSLLSKEEMDYFEVQKIYKQILNDNPNIKREDLLNLLRSKTVVKIKVLK